MNLAICLLMARRYVSKAEIRSIIADYRDMNDATFERTFGRDKDELRRLGVPVLMGSNDEYFTEDVGYRIPRKDFELPPIEFDAAELAVLGLASQVWDEATQADQAKSALAKLRAAGVDPDPGRLASLAPRIGVKEAAFAPIWQAITARIPVSFAYRGKRREYQPWALTYRRGAWYTYGMDTSVGEPRIYRLIRIESEVVFAGEPDSFTPEPVDTRTLIAQLEPAGPDSQAVLAIRLGRAGTLARGGTPAQAAVPPGFAAYAVEYSSAGDFAAEVCSFGPDVIVLEPPELRAQVVSHLRRFAGGADDDK
jgi:proteasome accessory factor B